MSASKGLPGSVQRPLLSGPQGHRLLLAHWPLWSSERASAQLSRHCNGAHVRVEDRQGDAASATAGGKVLQRGGRWGDQGVRDMATHHQPATILSWSPPRRPATGGSLVWGGRGPGRALRPQFNPYLACPPGGCPVPTCARRPAARCPLLSGRNHFLTQTPHIPSHRPPRTWEDGQASGLRLRTAQIVPGRRNRAPQGLPGSRAHLWAPEEEGNPCSSHRLLPRAGPGLDPARREPVPRKSRKLRHSPVAISPAEGGQRSDHESPAHEEGTCDFTQS